MSTSKTSGPLAVLKFPRLDLLLIAFATAILLALTGNAYYPSPFPTLLVFAADLAAYEKAQGVAGTKAKGAATQRNARRQKVIEDLKHLRDYVQSVIESQTSFADACAMIASAGMSIRQTAARIKAALSAANTGTSGSVLLDAKSLGPYVVYYWQYSLDQSVWTSVPETMKSRVVISGLTSAKTYYFRFHALTRKGPVDFSQVVSLLVH